MTYSFLLASRVADDPANPLSLKGASMDEAFAPKSLATASAPAWHKPVFSVRYPAEEALAFPDEVWLNTGERKLDFDLRVDMHGLIVSQAARDVLGDALGAHFKVAALTVVNRKGAVITPGQMWFAKPFEQKKVWDETKTVQVDREVPGDFMPILLRQFDTFELDQGLTDSIVFPFGIDGCVLLDEGLTDAVRAAGLTGMDIVSRQDFVARYNARTELQMQSA